MVTEAVRARRRKYRLRVRALKRAMGKQPGVVRTKRPRKRRPKGAAAPAVIQKVHSLEQKVKAIKDRTDGPKSLDAYTLTVDLGYVSSCLTDGLAKQLSILLNPLLMKTPGSGETTTPLVQKASLYQMWRILHCTLHFEPLVGSSAVGGTLALATMVQDAGETGDVNVDNLYTREKHQLSLGKAAKWTLPARALQGPRGGWWYMDPDKEQTATLGPLVEVWTYGKTFSTYAQDPEKAVSWSLWRVRAHVTYNFSGFDPKPELRQMVKSEPESVVAEATVDADGHGVVKLANATTGRPAGPLIGASGDRRATEIIWAVSDAVVEALSVIPGWGWLIKGGWWFIKKLAGKAFIDWLAANPLLAATNSWTDVYMVYQSFDDARLNRPWNAPPLPQKSLTWTSDISWIQLTPSQRGDTPIVSQVWPTPLYGKMAPPRFDWAGNSPVNENILFNWSVAVPDFYFSAGSDTDPAIYIRNTRGEFAEQRFKNGVAYPLLIEDGLSTTVKGSLTVRPGAPVLRAAYDQGITLEGDITSVFLMLKEAYLSGSIPRGVWNFEIFAPYSGIAKHGTGYPTLLSLYTASSTPRGAVSCWIFVSNDLSLDGPASYPWTTKWSVKEHQFALWVVFSGNPWTSFTALFPEFQVDNNGSWCGYNNRTSVVVTPAGGVDRPGGTTAVDGLDLVGATAALSVDDSDESDISATQHSLRTLERELVDGVNSITGGPRMGTCSMCVYQVRHSMELCCFMRWKETAPDMTLKKSPFNQLAAHYSDELMEKDTWIPALWRVYRDLCREDRSD